MKILAQYNRSLEESEEEWVLVEMLGHEVFIQMESGFRGDEYDLNTYTLDVMSKNFPKTLSLLMKIKQSNWLLQEIAKEKKSQEGPDWETGR